jgi:hypothetical protein
MKFLKSLKKYKFWVSPKELQRLYATESTWNLAIKSLSKHNAQISKAINTKNEALKETITFCHEQAYHTSGSARIEGLCQDALNINF